MARLGTLRESGEPHLVPFVFALKDETIYSLVDDKPKRTRDLQRLANIAAHPWVTALVEEAGVLYVGTYGGGVARRVARESRGGAGLVDRAQYEAFAETLGLKINPGCLLRAGGRLYAGTDGAGLWRSSEDGARFERLDPTLPSPRVTALAAREDLLVVGTDEGLVTLPLRGLR